MPRFWPRVPLLARRRFQPACSRSSLDASRRSQASGTRPAAKCAPRSRCSRRGATASRRSRTRDRSFRRRRVRAARPPAWMTRRRALWLGAAATARGGRGVTVWQVWPTTCPGAIAGRPAIPQRAGGRSARPSVRRDHRGPDPPDCRKSRRSAWSRCAGSSTTRARASTRATSGRDLNVENILSGTLTRQGAKLKIEVTLIETADGRTLWSHTYDREAAALLNVQDEIASAILDEGLRVRLSTAERRRMIRHPTTDAEAYDLYMQARHLQRRGTEDDYMRSKELLERAIQRDEQFSLAYAAMSAIYAMLVDRRLHASDRRMAGGQQVPAAGRSRSIPTFLTPAATSTPTRFSSTGTGMPPRKPGERSLQTQSNSFDPDDLRAARDRALGARPRRTKHSKWSVAPASSIP